MTKATFAILGPDGEIITALRGSLTDAVGEATSISGDPGLVIVDGTAESAGGLQPNGELAQISGLKVTPEKALARCKLPHLTAADFAHIKPDEAYERIAEPFLRLRKHGRKIKAYQTPAGLAKSLLGQNAKTSKRDPNAKLAHVDMFRGARRQIATSGLSLLPTNKFWKGHGITPSGNVCVGASAECATACLVKTGHNESDPYNAKVKLARMEALYRDPAAFVSLLMHEMRRKVDAGRRNGTENFMRCNVFSDIPWELVCPDLFAMLPDVMLYDYTKVPGREFIRNYDLTFSFSGRNEDDCKSELRRGRRVAVVFLSRAEKKKQEKKYWPLPEKFWGHPVVNGDYSDARPCDPPNVLHREPCIVGLHYKLPKGVGAKVKDLANFVVQDWETGDHPYASGYQRFAKLRSNPGIPTVVTQVHEIDGWLCVAGTPVQEGADDWWEEEDVEA